MNLTKTELRFIKPFIVHDMTLVYCYDEWCWNGDEYDPQRSMATINKLIGKGLLEICGNNMVIVSTDKGISLRCKHCYKGDVYDDYNIPVSKCSKCNGTGITT